jgi:AsmA protein
VLLPQRELDYAVRGKIGAMEEPQAGGGANLSGLEIPVKVTGNWQRPQLQPDVNAVLKDPNQAIGAAKEILKSDKAKNFLKNLLGK